MIAADVDAGHGEATLEASFECRDFGLISERLEPMAASASLFVDGRWVQPKTLGPFKWAWTWTAQPGQTVRFERIVALVRADVPDGNPGEAARTQLAAASDLGWAGILDQHEADWAQRWLDSDIVIGGHPDAQHALRFALYHLNSAANPGDPTVSIAARALTGADYHGHVFWDTEIFLLPFYTLTWPEAARALLTYRHRTLDGARAKAKRMGWRGAMYAWESASTGAETCPEHAIGPDRRIVDILCGAQELHISADVAYAVWHYWEATADGEAATCRSAWMPPRRCSR